MNKDRHAIVEICYEGSVLATFDFEKMMRNLNQIVTQSNREEGRERKRVRKKESEAGKWTRCSSKKENNKFN